jgi:hypothetical protein
MRLSFYPILQYNSSMGDGIGPLSPQDEFPDDPNLGDPEQPEGGGSTGAEDPDDNYKDPVGGGVRGKDDPSPQDDIPTFSTVQYYKIDLYNTKSNLYGEAVEKWYYPPYILNCNVERNDIAFTDTEYGVDENQTMTLFVKHIDLVNLDITPQVGDIFRDVGRHFEVSGVNRIMQPDPALGFQIDGSPFYVVSYVITGYLTRTSKLNIVKYSS